MIWKDITLLVEKGEFKYGDLGIGGVNEVIEYKLGKYMQYIVVAVNELGKTDKIYFGTESSEIIADALNSFPVTRAMKKIQKATPEDKPDAHV
jgi:hypothetical protein